MAKNDLVFTEMRLRHLREVYKIEKKSFTAPWSYRVFLYEITSNDLAHYFVALKGREIVGYAGMWIIIDNAHITSIAVAPGYRGKGFGKKILEEMMTRAVNLGAVSMELEVRVSNNRARHLYKSFGFREEGSRKNYYSDNSEDALIMINNNLSTSIENFNSKAGIFYPNVQINQK